MGKNKISKLIGLWILAVFITLAAVFYQNRTGPTHDQRIKVSVKGEAEQLIRLPRSHAGETDCSVELEIPDKDVTGTIFYRRFPTNEEWNIKSLDRSGELLTALLPHQPPAGKLEYYIVLTGGEHDLILPEAEPVVIRFRGDVPAGIIIVHAGLMFIAMLLSNLVLFLALFSMNQYRLYAWITTAVLFIGGGIFGPLMQKYAFGEWWTGFPLGFDLTDNKTLIAFVFWIIALIGVYKKKGRYLVILASLVMLIIFSIPHSLRGSELDPDTGEIKTGMVAMPGKHV